MAEETPKVQLTECEALLMKHLNLVGPLRHIFGASAREFTDALEVLLAQEIENAASVLAARLAEAEQAAEQRALHAAADALEGRLGVEGTPKTLWEFRAWLRSRARALVAQQRDGGDSNGRQAQGD